MGGLAPRADFPVASRIVPLSAHAAFEKASQYFGIKIHFIPVDRESRKVNLKLVKKAVRLASMSDRSLAR